MAELSKNQISGGTPVSSEDEKKDTSKQYAGSPTKGKAKLAITYLDIHGKAIIL